VSARDDGFTILEALVAFAILASVLMALYGAGGLSVRLIGDGGREREAILLLRSKLDELKAIPDPLPPAANGAFAASDFSWRLETRDLPSRHADGRGLRLQSVHLTISWPRGSRSVETRHLGTVAP
jgi:hypothetical protein